ncbi:hypothetical protein [Natrinema pallidum]|uniref:Uncharacterized protein n=1 Tax=Natrinema pallidum DSM 3751 TaxID=1227495 RepID=L9YVS1_9EURY|nr:hypothetical protein [Natrinema pallidum]ELY78229.1 hypothetical protein C487_09384 [Natrinema pallidum DSM 3751]
MATDDSDSDTVTEGETNSEPLVSNLGAGPGLRSILATAFALLRGRPSLAIPFAVAGALGATSTVARLESPYPVGLAPFPEGGLVRLSLPFVPRLEPTVEMSPAILTGMKPRFLVSFVGWQVAISAATAVAFAGCLWLADADTDGVTPPLDRVAWLVAYVVVIDSVLFGALFLSSPASAGVGLALVALFTLAPFLVWLFVAPAIIVVGGKRPIAAVIESLDYAVASPGTILAILVGLGYVGYALTGVSRLASSTTVGATLAPVLSATVTGTAHAVAVTALYRIRLQ